MNITRILTVTISFMALALTSCHESPYIANPGDNGHNLPDSTLTNMADNDSTVLAEVARLRGLGNQVLTVEEAIKLCQEHKGWSKGSGSTTSFNSPDKYYVYGVVTGEYSSRTSSETEAYFYIQSSEHSIKTKQFLAYAVHPQGASFPHGVARYVGRNRWVILHTYLCLFGSTCETSTNAENKVVFSSYTVPKIQTQGQGTQDDPYTILDALTLAKQADGVKENEWIRGYLVGTNLNDSLETAQPYKNNTTIVLADDNDEYQIANTVTIDLWSGLKYKAAREAISPFYEAGKQYLGQIVKVKGAIPGTTNENAILHVASPDSIVIGEKSWKK